MRCPAASDHAGGGLFRVLRRPLCPDDHHDGANLLSRHVAEVRRKLYRLAGRCGGGGGLARGKANRPRRRWPIPLPRGVINLIQPSIGQRCQTIRAFLTPLKEADMDRIVTSSYPGNILGTFERSWLKRKRNRVDINFRSYWQRNRLRITCWRPSLNRVHPRTTASAWANLPAARFRCGFEGLAIEAPVCATIRNPRKDDARSRREKAPHRDERFPIEDVGHRNPDENDRTEGDHSTLRRKKKRKGGGSEICESNDVGTPMFRHVEDVIVQNDRAVWPCDNRPKQIAANGRANRKAGKHEVPAAPLRFDK